MSIPTFEDLRRALFRSHGEGRYEEALAAAREAWRRFPEHEARTAYWVACLLCREGKPQEALRVLRDARSRGHWWGEGLLTKDPDLEPLWGRTEFLRLVEECRGAHRAAQAAAKPRVLVLRPDVLLPASPHPLLLSLHGRGGSAEEYAPYFQSATACGWIISLAQGTQLEGEEMYTWDEPAQAERDVAWAYGDVVQSQPVDRGRTVLAGVSQGGALAIDLALKGAPIPACGFIAVVPSPGGTEAALAHAPHAARRGVRGWILTGDKDPRVGKVHSLHELLVQAGLTCRLEVVPGLGHEIPEGFPARLARALEFVTSL
jgi:predicted esterase